MWGDCGTLYYLIMPDDLAELRFASSAFAWQCADTNDAWTRPASTGIDHGRVGVAPQIPMDPAGARGEPTCRVSRFADSQSSPLLDPHSFTVAASGLASASAAIRSATSDCVRSAEGTGPRGRVYAVATGAP